ncbi:MAG: hypothetical protein Q8R46_10950 [Nitrosomonas sp.]|uniref:hypothetical protein n=1 Tax=Nitrosomonas sp. TaxID=42353 RepID=UPI0027352192|nr:hypothetical protein [Nitrosomonas sp.]MDP3663904.1 hypothetical protein [Nitrosomonas sp.]
MSTLHRLRTVWLVLCALAAGVVALAWSGGTPDNIVWALFIGIGLLAAATRASTWFGALSCLWLGGVAVAVAMALDKGGSNDVSSVIVFGGGGYIALVTIMWIIKPMFKGGARP